MATVWKTVRILPLAIGLSLFALGLGGAYHYYTAPKQADLGGNQVIELAQCSQGYAEGNCPVTSFDWLGSLVNPSSNVSPSLIQIWGLQGIDIDTCGIPATYVSNIPSTGAGGQGGSSSSPLYEPLGDGIRGVMTYESTVLFYTSSAYTLADGCSGRTFASAVTTSPIQGLVSYPAGGSQTMTLGTGATYDFSLINVYMALITAGGFVAAFGFFLAYGKLLDQ